MNKRLSEKIRELRKTHNLTQEQLADMLGIAFQSVSKWETGIALPDISYVLRLAAIFNITTDELLGFNRQEMLDDIKQIVTDACKYREADPKKAYGIICVGLDKYPDNEILLNNLLYCIDYTHNPDETLKIAGKLIDRTAEPDIKYDALRFVAYAYNAKGDEAGAMSALEQIPELYFSKLSEAAFVLSGEAKQNAAEKQKWLSFETLLQMMCKLSECYRDKGQTDRAVAEIKKAIALIDLFSDSEKANAFQNYVEFFKRQLDSLM